jgi:hypothetical protein
MTEVAMEHNPANGFAAAPAEMKFSLDLHFQLGVHLDKETGSASFCPAVTRPVFAWSSTNIVDSGKEPSLRGQISFRLEPRSSAILLTKAAEVLHDN